MLGRRLKLAPDKPDVNFLLGYLYLQKKDFARAADFLGIATTMWSGERASLDLARSIEAAS